MSAASVRALPPGALLEGVGEAELSDMSTHVLTLAPLPEHVGVARAFVLDHRDGLSADEVDVLELLTSELVTNAVIHARTDLEVAVTITVAAVVVSVFDHDLGRRELPSRTPRDGGRGLVLVEALAAAWAVHVHRAGGKSVWFRLDRLVADPTHSPATLPASEGRE